MARRRYRNELDESQSKGVAYFQHYMQYLHVIALQMIEWHGLPESVNERFLETTLHTEGQCAFINHPKFGYLVARGTPSMGLDIYGLPLKYQCIFNGGTIHNFESTLYHYRDDSDNKDGVLMLNNDMSIPTIPNLKIFAQDLAHIKQVKKININNQKTPFILATNDKNLMSIKKLQNHMDSDAHHIIVDEQLNLDDIHVKVTPAPFVADKLQAEFLNTWNECMTFLGIDNVNTQKKERLLVDEINANNEQQRASENVYLKTRQQAAKQINELFGLNVSCKIRTETIQQIEHMTEQLERGV